jgi:hypothetical protein
MNNKCEICHQEPKPNCDWQQGRCPHREPLFKIQPGDPSQGHFYVSIAKSFIRIGAAAALIMGNLFFAGSLLIFAELLGILEEMV